MDAFKTSEYVEKISEEIHSIFTDLEETLKSDNMDQRKEMKDKFDQKMREFVAKYDPYPELHKPVEYIRNGLGSWFT